MIFFFDFFAITDRLNYSYSVGSRKSVALLVEWLKLVRRSVERRPVGQSTAGRTGRPGLEWWRLRRAAAAFPGSGTRPAMIGGRRQNPGGSPSEIDWLCDENCLDGRHHWSRLRSPAEAMKRSHWRKNEKNSFHVIISLILSIDCMIDRNNVTIGHFLLFSPIFMWFYYERLIVDGTRRSGIKFTHNYRRLHATSGSKSVAVPVCLETRISLRRLRSSWKFHVINQSKPIKIKQSNKGINDKKNSKFKKVKEMNELHTTRQWKVAQIDIQRKKIQTEKKSKSKPDKFVNCGRLQESKSNKSINQWHDTADWHWKIKTSQTRMKKMYKSPCSYGPLA